MIRHGVDCCGSGYGQFDGACEWDNQTLGFIKCGQVLIR